eukprot:1758750-Amphidinium_carterae.1
MLMLLVDADEEDKDDEDGVGRGLACSIVCVQECLIEVPPFCDTECGEDFLQFLLEHLEDAVFLPGCLGGTYTYTQTREMQYQTWLAQVDGVTPCLPSRPQTRLADFLGYMRSSV